MPLQGYDFTSACLFVAKSSYQGTVNIVRDACSLNNSSIVQESRMIATQQLSRECINELDEETAGKRPVTHGDQWKDLIQ